MAPAGSSRPALRGSSGPVRGSSRRALSTLTFGFFAGFAGVVVYGPVAAEFEAALGLSGLSLGLLVAAPQLTGSLLRIPFSAWADSAGATRPVTVLLGLSVVGMGGLVAILSTTPLDGLSTVHYPLIFAFGALSGCGIAVFSVGSTDISYWYRSRRRGTMLAVFAGLGNTSPGLFTIVAPVAMLTLGLTGTYAAWFGFLLAATVLFRLFAVDSPYFQFRERGLDRDAARERASDAGQELFPTGDALASLRAAATIPRSWALTAMFFVSFGGYLALTVWYPSYWHALHGLDPRTAGVVTALTFTVLSPLSRIGGGALSDRVGGEVTTVAAFGLVIVSSTALTIAHAFPVAIAATALLGAALGIASAGVFQLLPQYVPEAVGGASGLVGGFGAFGGFVLPPLLGLIVDVAGVTGYATGFVVFLVLGVAALGLAARLHLGGQTAEPAPAGSASGDD